MSGRIHIFEQRGTEWFAHRRGRVTGSKIAAIMAKGRGGAPSATRKTYWGELIAERIGDYTADSFTSAAMQWGTDQEPAARAMYEFTRAVTVQEVGFIDHPFIEMAGCSPDGLVGDDGMIEIKCPNTATHIDTLRGGSIDGGYMKQMQWQMACAARAWCDFVSFDPRLAPEMQMHVTRVPADPEMQAEITDAVALFLAEVDEGVADLRARYMAEAA